MIDKMPVQTTVEDILALFREHERVVREDRAEAEQRLREHERLREEDRAEAEQRLREHERLREEERAEAEQRMKQERAEAEQRMKQERAEAEQRMKQERAEAEQRMKQERAEAARRMRELERVVENTSREVDKTARAVHEQWKQLGALTSVLGRFVEEMVAPAVVALFTARGIGVRSVHQRVRSRRDGESMEIDVLAVDDTQVVAVEAKSQLGADDVKEQVERLGRFKTMFPHYAGCRVLGAVAAMVVPDQVARQAYKAGLYVMAPSGETMRILNDEGFEAKAW
jgi:DNA segregation ATPase FtsK/SpoIIIE-like protein